MQNPENRARVVEATLAFLEGTPLAAPPHERQLLNQFIAGELTIAQVVELLETRTQGPQAATTLPGT